MHFKTSHFVREFLANCAMGIPSVRDRRIRSSRTTQDDVKAHSKLILDQYIFFTSNFSPKSIQGSSILELGPGDAAPLAMLFIASGASRYVALDRFPGDITSPRALAIYEAVLLRAQATGIELSHLNLDNFSKASILDWFSREKRIRIEPLSADEEVVASLGPFDLIVSFNVVEHLSNLERAFSNLNQILEKDGVMIHRVDYGPHDVWRSYTNLLSFLAIPDWVWDVLGSNRGYPNRLRHQQIVEQLSQLGLAVSSRISKMAPAECAQELWSTLANRYPGLTAEQISILSAELICSPTEPRKIELGFEAIQAKSTV